MAEVHIKHHVILIDDEDLSLIGDTGWLVDIAGSAAKPIHYVKAWRGGRIVGLHRLILQAPHGLVVDHINGNGLDNRRCNLRLCTSAQNSQNRRMSTNNKLGVKGVYYEKERDRYVAKITTHKRVIKLGRFLTAEEASAAYQQAALALHGEFANHICQPSTNCRATPAAQLQESMA